MQFTYSADYLRDRIKFLADSSNGNSYPSARKAIAAALAAHGLIKLTFLDACARYSDMQSTGHVIVALTSGFHRTYMNLIDGYIYDS